MSSEENVLKRVANEVLVCKKCPLWKGRKRAVPGEGPADSKLILVGEAPGRREDELGRPFVGSAGRRLETLLESAGMSRDEAFITNIVKCRPPRNRRPRRSEAKMCDQYLRRQMAAVNPSLVVLLGDTALKHFFPGGRLSSAHGKVLRKDGIRFLPTYHPASITYDRSLERAVHKDLGRIRKLLGG